ncbi:MAG: DUF1016 N-terminal domain-containing protein [Ginsengibacter sp.]
MKIINVDDNYKRLLNHISNIYLQGQKKASIAVNTNLVNTYWHIEQYIVEFEQEGSAKAEYGKGLLQDLSKDLALTHGKGFSLSNVKRMRQFYLVYPIGAELPHQLSWTHLVELLKIDDPLERSFYQNQILIERWSTTELIRQKKSSLFLRLAASKNKEGILQLARQGQMVQQPVDLMREPYSLNFKNSGTLPFK